MVISQVPLKVKQGKVMFLMTRVTYRKNPKISDTQKFAVITLKVEQDGISLEYCIKKMQRELQTV